jgi:hypothetical protein
VIQVLCLRMASPYGLLLIWDSAADGCWWPFPPPCSMSSLDACSVLNPLVGMEGFEVSAGSLLNRSSEACEDDKHIVRQSQ